MSPTRKSPPWGEVVSVRPPQTHSSFCSSCSGPPWTGHGLSSLSFPAPTNTCHGEKLEKTEGLGSVLSGGGYNTMPALVSCVVLAGLLNLDVPQTPHLENGDSTCKELGRASIKMNYLMLFIDACVHAHPQRQTELVAIHLWLHGKVLGN